MSAGCTLSREVDDGLFLEGDVLASHAEKPKGVSKQVLYKIWRISEDEARQTIEVTTQLERQSAESSLSRNVGTNDCFFCSMQE